MEHLRRGGSQQFRLQDEGWTLEVLAKMLSERPARIAGLHHRKGAIRKGFDADLVIWHPYMLANTSAAASFSRHPETPFRDLRLQGKVQATFVQGAVAFEDGQRSWPFLSCGSAVST
jgi:allantoinase